jgi:hypothetical protein
VTGEHNDAGSGVDSEAYEITWFAPDRPVDGTVFVRQAGGEEAGGRAGTDTDEC